MKRVIIESPYRGENDFITSFNETYARACMADCLSRGEAPFAYHLLYTQPGVLNDKISGERQLGIDAGIAWSGVADLVAVYYDLGISEGMRYGITKHGEAGRTIVTRVLGGTWADHHHLLQSGGISAETLAAYER